MKRGSTSSIGRIGIHAREVKSINFPRGSIFTNSLQNGVIVIANGSERSNDNLEGG